MEPLLTINLYENKRVPEVIYKGEQLDGIVNVKLDYQTSEGEPFTGKSEYFLEYFDKQYKNGELFKLVKKKIGEDLIHIENENDYKFKTAKRIDFDLSTEEFFDRL
ncbi:hypothetical protein [Rummeliibacillus stabekisii]|uniref:hypothetical protein n=1 Tax=Rummeliibacillus stabekisii TaxID=241244 RepID=UPI0037220D9B